MDMMPIKPKRKAQLDDYAERHGQDVVTALDDVLSDYFAGNNRNIRKQRRASVKALRNRSGPRVAG